MTATATVTENKANIERAMAALRSSIPDHAERVNAYTALIRAAVAFCDARDSMDKSLAELDCMSTDALAALADAVDQVYWW